MRAHATGAEERVQEAAVQQPYESSYESYESSVGAV